MEGRSEGKGRRRVDGRRELREGERSQRSKGKGRRGEREEKRRLE